MVEQLTLTHTLGCSLSFSLYLWRLGETFQSLSLSLSLSLSHPLSHNPSGNCVAVLIVGSRLLEDAIISGTRSPRVEFYPCLGSNVVFESEVSILTWGLLIGL